MSKREQFVSYIDTDSLFIRLGHFLDQQGVDIPVWDALPQETRVKYLLKLSKYIEGNINDRMFEETQCIDYTSAVPRDDFSIEFKQEIVCDNALHIAPKMYAFHVINDEGFDADKVDAKGIETVRSSSPTVFRDGLKGLLELLLTATPDDDIMEYVSDKIVAFYNARPEDISTNIGVNNMAKYRDPDNMYIKGTPYHIKGALNYMHLLKKFELDHKYEPIREGDKCKFTYVKKNMHGIDGITYFEWPKEFKKHGILPDVEKQIEKYFVGKAQILLEPIHKMNLLDSSGNAEADFF
jgi:DNA polymerase elongation subunit (family B)